MGDRRPTAEHEPRWCASCGRRIEWRAKWARDWESVRYCSDACRRTKVGPIDRALETAILDLLANRARGATICPSEAAREVAGTAEVAGAARTDDPEPWRDLMEPARRAARRLVVTGDVEITQRGRVVDGSTAKGPIRIRRVG